MTTLTNSDISDIFRKTAQLMELHGENEFKIRSYINAGFRVERIPEPLCEMNMSELEKLEGIGKGIAARIVELNNTGTTSELDRLYSLTPEGILDMLEIKGIGPKKVSVLWRELGVENIGDLLGACNENRLVQIKGFGAKTQDIIRKAIEFRIGNSGKYKYAKLEEIAKNILSVWRKEIPSASVTFTGELRRKCEILTSIDLICFDTDIDRIEKVMVKCGFEKTESNGNQVLSFRSENGTPVHIYVTNRDEFYSKLFETTGNEKHISESGYQSGKKFDSEEHLYESLKLNFIPAELREGLGEIELAKNNQVPKLLKPEDLRGILHNHSTYSDGIHTLREMAVYCKELGYEYLGISDHSQTAFYAHGLKPEMVLKQHLEIDQLNIELAPFKIFKGIESDILGDGALDYEEDILASFDFIVASIHSNLRMTEEKATARLLHAIENPYTTILGHPTGRLILAREGYPINHEKIIDACAWNGVVIELNASPYRLDIDWRWIQYAIKKDVMISINPDAHEKSGYHDMYYGVCAARKGGLTKEMTFNAKSRDEMTKYFEGRRVV